MTSIETFFNLAHYRNLLDPSLKARDIGRRWGPPEKIILANNIKKIWEKSMWPARKEETLDFNAIVQMGTYKDNEPYSLKKKDFFTTKRTDVLARLETDRDVHALRAFLDENKNPQSTLITMFFPLERGDRPEIRREETGTGKDIGTEILLLRRELRDLAVNNVRRLIISGSHSPAFSFFLLEAGIAVIDVIPLPAMFEFALQQEFFGNKIIIPVTGDVGAGAMGELVEKLAAENHVNSENSIHALKTKAGNETVVHFDPEDLKRIKGKIAVIPEDILATGGTLKDTSDKLIEAGVEEVVILVSYPFFANSALQRLGNNPKIKIITTDGFTPQTDISQADNIFVMPIFNRFAGILDIDRKGMNLFSPQGKAELKDRGFCLNPWMDI